MKVAERTWFDAFSSNTLMKSQDSNVRRLSRWGGGVIVPCLWDVTLLLVLTTSMNFLARELPFRSNDEPGGTRLRRSRSSVVASGEAPCGGCRSRFSSAERNASKC